MSRLILVDSDDEKLGYASLEETHTGHGKRHRAFVTLLINSKNQVLLQKRRHRLFDGFWDLTAISHTLHVNGLDETYQEASDRALKKEMGIGSVEVRNIGAFTYFAQDGKNCENEYCAVLIGNYDGEYRANPLEVYGSNWVGFASFIKDVERNPKKYTPWAVRAAKILTKTDLSMGNASVFGEELEKFLKTFNSYASSYFQKRFKALGQYPSLIRRFYKDLEDISQGGKRMRGFLVYLGYLMGGGKETKSILSVALAVEILHTFLLIHDDIIDKSDTRRGKVTIHKRFEKIFGQHYGVSQGIIVGDIACFEALSLVNSSDFEESLKVKCQKKLYEVILETAYGEALDVEYSYRPAKIKDILNVADLKTARYSLVGPLTIGGLLGGASERQLAAYEKFGLAMGLAFQLQDDYLGVYGDEKVLGKSVLSDMREGKNTLLIYKARELGTTDDRKIIDRLWGKPDSKIDDLEKIKKILINIGAVRWHEHEMIDLVNRARKHVKPMTSDIKLQKVIGEMVDFVVSRKS